MTTKKQKETIFRKFRDWMHENVDHYSLHDDGTSIVSKSLFNQAAAELTIGASVLKQTIEEGVNYETYIIVTDAFYKKKSDEQDIEDARREAEEVAKTAIMDEEFKKQTDLFKWFAYPIVAAIVLFILWRVAVGVSAVGQMQSSPGDRACEQLGGRASGDRCVFR